MTGAGRGAHFQNGKGRMRHPGIAGVDLAPEGIVCRARDPFASASAANRLRRALSAVSQGSNSISAVGSALVRRL